MSDFGNFLYSLRKEKGMTQMELADRLGVTNKAVSKWETGDAMPETSLLLPISRIFDVSVDELLAGERKLNKQAGERETNAQNEDAADQKSGGNDEIKVDFSAEKNNGSAEFDVKKHIFARCGDECGPKTMLDVIGGALCSATVLIGIVAFLIIGGVTGDWHPFWVLIPACAFLSGIFGAIFDACNKEKRRIKKERGENPIVGAICAVIMLISLTVFLTLGAFLDMWHPIWIIVVVGAILCAIIGVAEKIVTYRKEHNKK